MTNKFKGFGVEVTNYKDIPKAISDIINNKKLKWMFDGGQEFNIQVNFAGNDEELWHVAIFPHPMLMENYHRKQEEKKVSKIKPLKDKKSKDPKDPLTQSWNSKEDYHWDNY